MNMFVGSGLLIEIGNATFIYYDNNIRYLFVKLDGV